MKQHAKVAWKGKVRSLIGTTLQEAESSKCNFPAHVQTEAGAVVKEFCSSLPKKSMSRLKDIINRCPRECHKRKVKQTNSQEKGAKLTAKQKLIEEALAGLDRIPNDELIIKEMIEEDEYAVIARIVQLRTYEEITVDGSSLQISKLSSDAGIKINGRDFALLIGGSAVRMIKFLDLQKLNAHIKCNEISNKLVRQLCTVDIDVDTARRARDGIIEKMLSLQDMDVPDKDSEAFEIEINAMFDDLLDATDEVEALRKEVAAIGMDVIALYQQHSSSSMDPLATKLVNVMEALEQCFLPIMKPSSDVIDDMIQDFKDNQEARIQTFLDALDACPEFKYGDHSDYLHYNW